MEESKPEAKPIHHNSDVARRSAKANTENAAAIANTRPAQPNRAGVDMVVSRTIKPFSTATATTKRNTRDTSTALNVRGMGSTSTPSLEIGCVLGGTRGARSTSKREQEQERAPANARTVRKGASETHDQRGQLLYPPISRDSLLSDHLQSEGHKQQLHTRQKKADRQEETVLYSDKKANNVNDGSITCATNALLQQQVVTDLKRQLASAQKIASTAHSQQQRGQILLEKALEDCKQHKVKMTEHVQAEYKARDEIHQQQLVSLTSRVKALERQRSDFLAAFKGQSRYIDILQRQKLHAEAAVLLNFTEEEFTKVMETGK
jgi:hypothetical protein